MKVDKKTVVALGVLATIGVTGLAIMYRKQILQLITGTNLLRIRAVMAAQEEFSKWNKKGEKILEHDIRTVDKLDDYWKSTGHSYNGMRTQPWSAAFISYVMKKSGAGKAFPYSTSHSVYIRKAIENKKNNAGRFKGYKPEDVKVEVGDLVCYPRQAGVSYDTKSGYDSHCDICIDVNKRKNTATFIGGNVSDSVSKSTAPLTDKGKIDLDKTSKDYIVVIKY